MDEESRRSVQVQEKTVQAGQPLSQPPVPLAAGTLTRRPEAGRVRPARTLAAVLGTAGLLGGLGLALLWTGAAVPDDTSGGVATSVLMARCEDALKVRLDRSDLTFPSRREASAQLSASPDGKRWDGSLWQPGETGPPLQLDFSCVYTRATDQITTEIISP